jgi:hypothetical protein
MTPVRRVDRASDDTSSVQAIIVLTDRARRLSARNDRPFTICND